MSQRPQQLVVAANARGRRLRLVLVLALIASSLAMAGPSNAVSGTARMLVVLCNFQNQQHGLEGYDLDYYRDMFSSQGSGKLGSYDYWRDVSYTQLTLDATVVGWYTIPTQRDAWAANDRATRWRICVEQAAADVHYEAFVGAVAVIPDALARALSEVKAADTTITVMDDPSRFPATPFNAHFINGESIRVTARFGNDLVVERGYAGTKAADYTAGSWVQVDGTDLFGGAPSAVDLAGTTYTLGRAFMPHDVSLAGAVNETGHLLGFEHSTAASTFPSDYNDCYDVMSTYSSCSYLFDEGKRFGGTIYDGYSQYGKGPGLNAVQVDAAGWLPANRKATFDNTSCRQQTYSIAALNRPGISGLQQLRFTSGVPIFRYVAVELHDKSGWFRGIPASAFTLHAQLSDGRSMLIDRRGDGSAIGDEKTGVGGLVAGDEYVNPTLGMYVGVNNIGNGNGTLTMGSCKLKAALEYVGATQGRYSDTATLAGRLTVAGSSAPVPEVTVTLRLGGTSCTTTTDLTGLAQCNVTLSQAPGSYSASASYAGTSVYEPASDSASFTVEKEVTELVYAGALTSDYHDAFVAFGQLAEDDGPAVAGRGVTFTLGSGDSCTATTSSGGVASCSITPTQPAESYTMSTSFSGDATHLASSDSDPFVVTHEESTTTVTGPTVLLAGNGSTATLQARFVEDGPNGDGTDRTAVPAGQTISFTLGSESCSDTTDSSGVAQCSVNVPAAAALGPQLVSASFAGDAHYEPSSGTKNTIVFAFPSTGAFLLGDNTVASATPTTKVTWWSDAWWTLNSLSGGVAPDSFKGFATDVRQLPTTNPANSCGTTFSTPPGNSLTPPTEVPSYMGVIVASSAVKNKRGITGTWAKVVVVKTDAGYSTNPGFAGTGRIVATFCP